MTKLKFKVIGVMSGTSLDGIDLAYISFDEKATIEFEILKAETVSYSDTWKTKLENLVDLNSEELQDLDADYSELLANEIQNFIDTNAIEEIDFIASHGHTALHRPDLGYTLQIGNQKSISSKLNLPLICDFRVQDVKLGGQGAPLVPIGDLLLFSDFEYCINLGGFANVSFQDNGQRVAYDICPVNIVFNYFSSELGQAFDNSGNLAKSGQLQPSLLDILNSNDYFESSYPKSLGLEWVKSEVFPILINSGYSQIDILRTYCEHIAMQIVNQFNNVNKKDKVLFTGGGVYNTFLMSRIQDLTEATVVIPSNELVEYKEALIFGLLGGLKYLGRNNCLSSVTGASKNHSSGVIYKP
ncbi:MAG: anhydro-N-acetylmuramic acid kinase [Bacteroidetes bacterium MedPE-SWsnd-G2]|nr:MAG: anhydro-N-acetylmuramic acid kinase [Bacteroidetes bacterium MedPE-SWsnd-G2]